LRARLEHHLAGAVSGSPGRVLAFVADFAAAIWRTFRGDPRHPEERKLD